MPARRIALVVALTLGLALLRSPLAAIGFVVLLGIAWAGFLIVRRLYAQMVSR